MLGRTARIAQRMAAVAILVTALAAQLATAAPQDVVYLSATGTKYHRVSCRTLKKTPTKTTRTEAEKRGKQACKICKP